MQMMVLSRADRLLSRPAVLAPAFVVLLVGATVALRGEVAVSPAPHHLAAAVPVWWAAALLEAVTVLACLRWPVAALSAAVLATFVHMNAGYPPLPVDLAAPIALCATAIFSSRRMTAASLIGALAAAAGWSSYVLATLHGDPLATPGAFKALSGREIANLKRLHGPIATSPTAWGGVAVLGLVLIAFWLAGWLACC